MKKKFIKDIFIISFLCYGLLGCNNSVSSSSKANSSSFDPFVNKIEANLKEDVDYIDHESVYDDGFIYDGMCFPLRFLPSVSYYYKF